MRVLTVRNPWAWAIVHGGKDVENRVRNVAGGYRGTIAIHVGLRWDGGDDGRVEMTPREVRSAVEQKGWIVGVVDLENVHEARDCWTGVALLDGTTHEEHCSVWGEVDVHHLVLANPRPLVTPIPYKGALGLRRLPQDVAAAVWAEVAS